MKPRQLATLKHDEQANDNVKHDCLYLFKYNEQDKFLVLTPNGWVEETSTAFTFN